jgi:hypothetical protein
LGRLLEPNAEVAFRRRNALVAEDAQADASQAVSQTPEVLPARFPSLAAYAHRERP